ncbi:MAG: DUF433 domain-containing protein [Fimbriimonadaceae bacterium]|nr:DUF433 domain-containing protein [Fimbriimonadaceae bacterium]
MIPKELESILVATPDTLPGAVRFRGTRIHAQILFDYVLTGEPLDEYLDNYPEVSREQALAVLEWERKRMGRKLQLGKAS